MFRECALVQAACVCVCRHIAAGGHHLWPSPPSGLLWLQIVPLGSQELSLWMSEMARHRQSPASLDWSLCSVCIPLDYCYFCALMQKKSTLNSHFFFFSFPLFLSVLQVCFFLTSSCCGWLTDVSQLHCLPPPQCSSRPHGMTRNWQ